MMKPCTAATAAIFAAMLGSARAQVPLPADLAIDPPSPAVPADDAALSGAWGNDAWEGVLPAAVVVEHIDAQDEATVVYAVGDAAQWGVTAAWRRHRVAIEDHALTLRLAGGTVIQFRSDGCGHTAGTFTLQAGWRFNITLDRIPGTPAEVLATAALPVQPIWHDIRVPDTRASAQRQG